MIFVLFECQMISDRSVRIPEFIESDLEGQKNAGCALSRKQEKKAWLRTVQSIGPSER